MVGILTPSPPEISTATAGWLFLRAVSPSISVSWAMGWRSTDCYAVGAGRLRYYCRFQQRGRLDIATDSNHGRRCSWVMDGAGAATSPYAAGEVFASTGDFLAMAWAGPGVRSGPLSNQYFCALGPISCTLGYQHLCHKWGRIHHHQWFQP